LNILVFEFNYGKSPLFDFLHKQGITVSVKMDF
jgi:hypothetical protein